MKSEKQQEARGLRYSGLSINKIAEKIGVSKGSVSVWVRDIKLTNKQKKKLKENSSQAVLVGDESPIRKKHLEIRKKYQKEGRKLALQNNEYKSVAMLYWCEGAKNKNSLKFSNTDWDLLKFYWNELNKLFNINIDKVTLTLNCHLDCGIKIREIEDFWLNILNLPRSCLRKHTINYNREYYRKGKSNTKKLKYGCCTVSVHSTEFAQKIFGMIKSYANIIDENKWLD